MGFWVGLPKIFAFLEIKLDSFTIKPHHQNIKHKCKKCDVAYSNVESLKKHNQNNKNSTISIKNVCPICQFESCTKEGLYLHLKNRHPKSQKQKSELLNLLQEYKVQNSTKNKDSTLAVEKGLHFCCEKTFPNLVSFEEHMNNFHKSKQNNSKDKCEITSQKNTIVTSDTNNIVTSDTNTLITSNTNNTVTNDTDANDTMADTSDKNNAENINCENCAVIIWQTHCL